MMFYQPFLACLAVVAGGLTVVTSATSAEAKSPHAGWKTPSASVRQDPSTVVRAARSTRNMQVVRTIATPNGPVITTMPADSAGEARALVAKAQDADSTIAVSIAQPVDLAAVNDTKRSSQWALNTLSAESVWAKSTGSGVTVAVVDTGVKGSHPDLGGRVLAGYDVVTGGRKGNVDGNGHGTHVAGIIAATAGNGTGVAGFAPKVRILPVRVVDSRGASNTGYLAEGIVWAANNGAKIINISMGGSGVDPNLDTAIQYAASKNVVVVAAAGNERLDGNKVHYPAAYDNVLAVGASDSRNKIASYSNTGSYVDVVAPGSGIWSTYLSPGYAMMSGTSMATPYVSATAALAVSAAGTGYSATTIESEIMSTARDLGTAGRDNTYGFGLISPISAVTLASGGVLATKTSTSVPTGAILSGNTLTVSGRLQTSWGANIVGKAVAVSATYNGKTVSKTVRTSRTGRLFAGFALPANTKFRFRYPGSQALASSVTSASFLKVKPRTKVDHRTRSLVVTNINLYGQMVRLERKSGSAWKVVTEKRAYSSTWRVRLGRGTYRIRTLSTSRVMSSIPATWWSN